MFLDFAVAGISVTVEVDVKMYSSSQVNEDGTAGFAIEERFSLTTSLKDVSLRLGKSHYRTSTGPSSRLTAFYSPPSGLRPLPSICTWSL